MDLYRDNAQALHNEITFGRTAIKQAVDETQRTLGNITNDLALEISSLSDTIEGLERRISRFKFLPDLVLSLFLWPVMLVLLSLFSSRSRTALVLISLVSIIYYCGVLTTVSITTLLAGTSASILASLVYNITRRWTEKPEQHMQMIVYTQIDFKWHTHTEDY